MDNIEEKIAKLEKFVISLNDWDKSYQDPKKREALRSQINKNKAWVRQQVIEARCLHTVTIGPPPAVGGLVMENIDPFTMIFNAPYGMSLLSVITDMVEQAIGVLNLPPTGENKETDKPTLNVSVEKNYAFVAMSINPEDPALEDVLEAIKEGAGRCGVMAERVDEVESNERITDRILESINKAEFVIVDLTHSKPNVFYEAGYAQGIGKIPIYIAREGTKLEFDLKDYPVIFFNNMKNLKDKLESRLHALAKNKS
ncbi:hypothetical protein [Desulforhopalus sp. 52FAK]